MRPKTTPLEFLGCRPAPLRFNKYIKTKPKSITARSFSSLRTKQGASVHTQP